MAVSMLLIESLVGCVGVFSMRSIYKHGRFMCEIGIEARCLKTLRLFN